MAEKNPIEPFIDQITELVQTFENKLLNGEEMKGDPSDEEKLQVEYLTHQVYAMRQAYLQALKDTGLSEEQVKDATSKNREHMDPDQRRVLDRLDNIRLQAVKNANLVAAAVKEQKRNQATTGNVMKPSQSKDKKGKKHRKKNIHVSFRKGWQKM